MTGVLYGTTNVLVGHPFDTIKTKMQVQSGMMAVDSKSKGPSYIETIKKVYKTENGLRGFYKGWFPPLCGSIIFRSLQFAVYETFYTFAEKYPQTHEHIPMSGGI